MAYPSVITSFTNPNATDRLNAPSHSSIESAQNTGLSELMTFVGTLSSVAGSLVYDIRASASDGGGHVQSANKGGTGQTSYAKGDLIVAQSSSVLSKLTVGSNGQVLTADSAQSAGMKWGLVPGLGNFPTASIFTAASTLTWVKPSNLSYVIVEVIGGGGGSGGATGAAGNCGAGGGGGGYARKIINSSVLNATENFTVGAGGLRSSVGGTTSFGTASYLSATGGSGGGANASAGAAGGLGISGDVNIRGDAGGSGNAGTAVVPGAFGGGTAYGGLTPGVPAGNNGNPGSLFGSGASAGNSGGSAQIGAAGAPGAVIITHF